MTLPKGFGGGGGGASRSDVEGMIGRRIENYTTLITLSYLGAFFATMFSASKARKHHKELRII